MNIGAQSGVPNYIRTALHLLPCFNPTLEVLHDVVFFPPIKLGYLVGDTTGSELFVIEDRIT